MALNNARIPFIPTRKGGGSGRGDITSWARSTVWATRPDVAGIDRRFQPVSDLAALRRSADLIELKAANEHITHPHDPTEVVGIGLHITPEPEKRTLTVEHVALMHATSAAIGEVIGGKVLHKAPPKPAAIEFEEIEPSALALWLASKRDAQVSREVPCGV